MFAALLLTISVVAFAQFGAFYWRALVASEAAQPISQQVLDAVNANSSSLRGDDFHLFAELHALTPDLTRKSGGLGFVPAYYRLIHAVRTVATGRMTGLANWAQGEEALCASYAAVQVDRRLQANLAMASSLRAS
jgi:hypothetical protein